MDNRQLTEGRVNIITHVHTDASSAETSVLNDRIGAAIRHCAGEDTSMSWSECFTPVARLERILRDGAGSHGPVHQIWITDHMRSRSHELPDRHLGAAANTPGMALGAELATRTRDVDGKYRTGPEILAFGGPHLVEGPHGPYFGITQRLIEELYDTCLDDERGELCTRRARDLLIRRGVAHSLAHPLDGHALSLEGTLCIISEFAFTETVNGGYSARSARMLEAFVQLNNSLLAGASLPDEALGPMGRRIVRHILRHGRHIHTLGGSDAHSHDFDRVVTSMAPPWGRRPESMAPGDVFDAMLALARNRHNGAGVPSVSPFASVGRAASLGRLLADVSAIILRNLKRNIGHCPSLLTWGHVLATTVLITQDELRQQHQVQHLRVTQMTREFNPERLLQRLAPPRSGHASQPAGEVHELRGRGRRLAGTATGAGGLSFRIARR